MTLITMTACLKALTALALVLLTGGLVGARAQSAVAADLPIQKGHTNAVLEVWWSPDDTLLLTYSAADGYLSVWEAPGGKLRWRVEASRFVKDKKDERYALRAFAWSDDSRFIVTGSENGTAQVWDAATGRLIWKSRVAAEHVAGVAFSHDGRLVAATAAPEDEDLRLVLFEANAGAKVREFQGMGAPRFLTYYHDDRVIFAPGDKQLSVGDRRAVVTRWDVVSGMLLEKRELNPCRGEGRGPGSFAYARDLSFIAARCGKKTVLTDAGAGEVLRSYETGYESNALALSRDGNLVASGDLDDFKILDLRSGEVRSLKEHPPITCGCDFNRDATLFTFTEDLESEVVKVVEVGSGRTTARLEAHPGVVRALAFSPDGTLLASGSDDRVIRIWEAGSGKLHSVFTGHTKPVKAVAFSPDGKILVSGGDDQTIKVWDLASGSLLRSIEADREGIAGVNSAAFSPDGKRLVTTQGGTVTLWEADSWRPLQKFTTNESHTSGEYTICCGSEAISARFSADGSRIISGHVDGTVKVWKEGGDRPLRVVRTNERNESFALSPDEKLLACNTGEAPPGLWNWVNSRRLARLGEEASYVHNLTFSPDSRLLATSDIGGELLLWDARTGKLLREFDGGYSGDDAIAFSPDGKLLASGGENQNIIMWDARTGRRLWHLLSVDERRRPTPEETAERELEARRAEEEVKRVEAEAAALAPKVFVTFSHYGEPTDPWETRIVETGKPNKSLLKQSSAAATGVWLRFRNDSPLPVSISTESIYLPGKERCGYRAASGRFYGGLCEGAEVGIRVGVRDARGKPVSYGFDFGGVSMAPPKTSVLFSLPRGLLKEGRSVIIHYRFMKENARGKLVDYGEEREIKLTAAALPK